MAVECTEASSYRRSPLTPASLRDYIILRRLSGKKMARPEGFEPPTPRSVVLSNPQHHVLTWNRSHVFQGFSTFHFISVRLSTSHCGNARGNRFRFNARENTLGRLIKSSCRRATTSSGLLDSQRQEVERDRAKPGYPQILTCVHPESLCFSALYPALFPRCFHVDMDQTIKRTKLRG
jgi:hypothetical protein